MNKILPFLLISPLILSSCKGVCESAFPCSGGSNVMSPYGIKAPLETMVVGEERSVVLDQGDNPRLNLPLRWNQNEPAAKSNEPDLIFRSSSVEVRAIRDFVSTQTTVIKVKALASSYPNQAGILLDYSRRDIPKSSTATGFGVIIK